MSTVLSRLTRLHAVRSSIADALGVECKRIQAGLTVAEDARDVLRQQSATAFLSAPPSLLDWRSSQAVAQIAASQLQVCSDEITRMQEEHAEAKREERDAILQREQMGRLVEKHSRTELEQAARAEQQRLDEAHSVKLLRDRRTTAL